MQNVIILQLYYNVSISSRRRLLTSKIIAGSKSNVVDSFERLFFKIVVTFFFVIGKSTKNSSKIWITVIHTLTDNCPKFKLKI